MMDASVSSFSLTPAISLRCDEFRQVRMDVTQPYHLNLLAAAHPTSSSDFTSTAPRIMQ